MVAEGQAEESFLDKVLAPVLWSSGVYLRPVVLGTPGHKGGKVNYARVKKDVLALLKQDRTIYCSTMLDFYGLGAGFPGTPLQQNLRNIEKVIRIEQAIKTDITAQISDLRPDVRFLPYLQLHEYEGLLFSDPAAFADGIRQPHLRQSFEEIRQSFVSPEDINDHPDTAPSKRVLGIYPGYNKVLEGTLAAQSVGIARMLQECAHFRQWVERLQALSEI
ncbi:MAG TPA: DUF4276 family protein [Candidatus Angelobacter sp.]|nr:DUF4276 family protein [Candidatus Angelobacter sp.]